MADLRGLARAATWCFFGSLALALGLLVVSAMRPYALWPNVSDDFFYYLVLVRQSVLHGVVSSDGLRPTNGFHPLYFLTLRALYPLVTEAAFPNVAIAVLIAAHGVTALVLWRTARRIAGPVLGGAIAAIYAANLAVLRIVFAAVETPLMVLCLAVCLWAHVRWLESGEKRHRALALVALILAVAGRTDTVFLAAALALYPVLAALRARDLARAARAIDWAPALVAAIPIVAFGVWGLVATGEFVQTSGRALSFWQSVGFWRQTSETFAGLGAARGVATAACYALVVVGQYVAYTLRGIVELFLYHPLGWVLAIAAILAWRSRRDADQRPTDVAARLRRELILYAVLQWAFYALAFRHGQMWYWHGSIYVAALIAATCMTPLRAALERPPAIPRGAGALAVALVLVASWFMLGRVHPRPLLAPDRVVSAAPEPLQRVPDGATLGAFDTGQLAWEQPRLVVVNLDGLVNNAAYHALRERRIGAYMVEQRIDWLYVHDVVVRRFEPFGLDAWLQRAEPVARSASGVRLYRRLMP